MSICKMTISFDTNCLNDILNSDDLTNRFIEKIKLRSDVLISIPGNVITELFAGKRADKVSLRMKNLVRIWESIGDNNIQFTLTIKESLLAELKARIWFTPVIDRKLKQKVKIYLSNASSPTEENLAEIMSACGEVNEAKANVFSLDQNAASYIEKNGQMNGAFVSEVESYMENYKHSCSMLKWFYDDTFKNIGWKGKRPTLNEIGDKSRFKICRMFLAMTELTILGAAINGRSSNQTVQLFGPAKGNWYDNIIAATACRTSCLVTNDVNLRDKVSFLAEKGITKLKAMDYSQFESSNS